MYCTKCGLKNEDDAEFCTKCGIELINQEHGKKMGEDINRQSEKVGEKVDRVARNFGDAADRIGKRIEERFENVGKGFDHWYDKKFGIIGPLIWSFLGIIILRIIIEALAISSITTLVHISDFLYENFILLFGIILISSYNTFFYRKYKEHYRWFSPVISTAVFIVGLWILANILIIIENPFLFSIASFIETYLIAIFIIILIVSYAFIMVIQPFSKENK